MSACVSHAQITCPTTLIVPTEFLVLAPRPPSDLGPPPQTLGHHLRPWVIFLGRYQRGHRILRHFHHFACWYACLPQLLFNQRRALVSMPVVRAIVSTISTEPCPSPVSCFAASNSLFISCKRGYVAPIHGIDCTDCTAEKRLESVYSHSHV